MSTFTTETVYVGTDRYVIRYRPAFTSIDVYNVEMPSEPPRVIIIHDDELRPAAEWSAYLATFPKITPDMAGTWLDGTMGWHNAYRVIDRAQSYGFQIPPGYGEALRRYREDDYDGLTDDERSDTSGAIIDQGGLSDQATDFLEEHAPEGYTFVWDAGELSLMTVEDADTFGYFG